MAYQHITADAIQQVIERVDQIELEILAGLKTLQSLCDHYTPSLQLKEILQHV